MLEHIGERVRAEISNLEFIRVAGGLAFPVLKDDNGVSRIYPAARPWEGMPPGMPGGYVNMAPHETDSCIAFVDSQSDIEVKSSTAKHSEMQTFFRVVLWYDERQMLSSDPTQTKLAMVNDIIKVVSRTDFEAPGISAGKATLFNVTESIPAIWGVYGMGVDDRALFMAPYQTLAVTFKFSCRYTPECACGQVLISAKPC